MRKGLTDLFSICLTFSLILLAIFSLKTNLPTKPVLRSNWFLEKWNFRRLIEIEERSGEDLTEYQLPINISYSPGMRSDFSDIRFTYYNESSGEEFKIPYWIEKQVNSTWALVWVKVPYIPAYGTSVVYVYYGAEESVESESNPNEVFILYNNFVSDAEAWTCKGENRACQCGLKDGAAFIYQRPDSNVPGWDCSLYFDIDVKGFSMIAKFKIVDLLPGVNPSVRIGMHENYNGKIVGQGFGNPYGAYSWVWIDSTDTDVWRNVEYTNNTWETMYSFYDPDVPYSKIYFSDNRELSETYDIYKRTPGIFAIVLGSPGGYIYLDSIAIGKYTYPEPKVTIGSEEVRRVLPIPLQILEFAGLVSVIAVLVYVFTRKKR